MTDYTDVPTVAELYAQNERNQQALDMLADGGTMSNFMIAPPPAPPLSPGVPGPIPVVAAVTINVTEPLSDELMQALTDWLTTRQANIIAELATYDVGPPPPPPPTNSVAPVVAQDNDMMSCTEGTWDDDGSYSYAYQWQRDGITNIGTGSSQYVVTGDDVGRTLTCTVTATSAGGSTDAISNGVVVATPGQA